MKLYSEYHLKEVYFKGLDNGKNHIEGKCHDAINSQTPIELPSDEEVENASKKWVLGSQVWEKGAKWMKEQILNQNK